MPSGSNRRAERGAALAGCGRTSSRRRARSRWPISVLLRLARPSDITAPSRLELGQRSRTRLGPEFFRNLLGSATGESRRARLRRVGTPVVDLRILGLPLAAALVTGCGAAPPGPRVVALEVELPAAVGLLSIHGHVTRVSVGELLAEGIPVLIVEVDVGGTPTERLQVVVEDPRHVVRSRHNCPAVNGVNRIEVPLVDLGGAPLPPGPYLAVVTALDPAGVSHGGDVRRFEIGEVHE